MTWIPQQKILLTIAGWSVAACLFGAVGLATARVTSSATGSGHLTLEDGSLRTFAFSAVEDSSGEAHGQAQLFNRSTGNIIHLEIDCLSVVDNVATMSGFVKSTTAPEFDEATIWFRVVDNGQGRAAPPDEITLVTLFLGPGPLCTDNVGSELIPIEHGNVQVR